MFDKREKTNHAGERFKQFIMQVILAQTILK